MRLFLCSFLFAFAGFSQKTDTLAGFESKISGEEIVYYSPYQRFAKNALLTRCNNNGAISWNAPKYSGKAKYVCYEVLIGHSTGTSSGERKFEITLNGKEMLPWTTFPKMSGPFSQIVRQKNARAEFKFLEFDANKDAFGRLFITVPAKLVKNGAVFSINGVNQDSRDWLMVFQFQHSFQVQAEATQLITRKENKRQLNTYILQPYSTVKKVHVYSKHFDTTVALPYGYTKLNLPVYPLSFTGQDDVKFELEGETTGIGTTVHFQSAKHRNFNIIHHSHNDIGYSHIQTEVAKIQTQNIRSAISWVKNAKTGQRPIWHIESLWAVENFLNKATAEETADFVRFVKAGNLVLSANYANILTGLSRTEELDWMVEYAKILEKRFGIQIKNAMVTDIPGYTAEALAAYVRNDIPYLSLGPNYVEAFPDHGDRVGGVIQETADDLFFWKLKKTDAKKLLVWTAGKGYSYFHGIADSKMQEAWEQKLSDYLIELDGKNYPFEDVQLRYTKKADNGPVDTNLCAFIDNWNTSYISPQLTLASLNELFAKYAEILEPNESTQGEVAPYWEDGAYSTAAEEIGTRVLSEKTSALQAKAKATNQYTVLENEFYALRRNILLFHEHTWGAWCSVSDPESFFTTEQWRIKKSYFDSAYAIYQRLEAKIGQPELASIKQGTQKILDFEVDSEHGGLKTLTLEQEVLQLGKNYRLFEGIYQLGINPMVEQRMTNVQVSEFPTDNPFMKKVIVTGTIGGKMNVEITYHLDRQKQQLKVHYKLDKLEEKQKESFHIALTPNYEAFEFTFGSENYQKQVPECQLPGSNREFVCAETLIQLKNKYQFTYYLPQVNLVETNGIIDENLTNSVKTWVKKAQVPSDIFLYVFNNYWHTNYKATQSGTLEFDVILVMD